MNAANWPTELSPEFGEQEVKFLCDKFGLSFSNLKNDFRDYKDGGGEQRTVKINLRQLFNCIATVPISTAACERGFSRMNIICTSLRSQLSPENLAALMFISLSGPPLPSWNPLPYMSRLGLRSTEGMQRVLHAQKGRSNLRLNTILL